MVRSVSKLFLYLTVCSKNDSPDRQKLLALAFWDIIFLEDDTTMSLERIEAAFVKTSTIVDVPSTERDLFRAAVEERLNR